MNKVIYGVGFLASFLVGFWVGYFEGVKQTTEEAILAIEEVVDFATKGMADIIYEAQKDSLRESKE